MKKFGFALLVACIGFFAACSDDDDKKPEDYATVVAGVYKGDLKVAIAEGTPIASKDKISLTRTGENKVKLELKDFTLGGILTPGENIVINDVPVIKKGDGYALEETTANLELVGGLIKAKAKVTGTVIGKTMSLVIDVETTPLAGRATGTPAPLKVKVNFDGDKADLNKSEEAKIKTLTFDSEFVLTQPEIKDNVKALKVVVNKDATEAELKEIVMKITISDKATVLPAADAKVDLSKETFNVVVTAEDAFTTTTYVVSVEKGEAPATEE